MVESTRRRRSKEKSLRVQGGLQAQIKNDEDAEVEGLDSLDREVGIQDQFVRRWIMLCFVIYFFFFSCVHDSLR